jgi:hypothetical protein
MARPQCPHHPKHWLVLGGAKLAPTYRVREAEHFNIISLPAKVQLNAQSPLRRDWLAMPTQNLPAFKMALK